MSTEVNYVKEVMATTALLKVLQKKIFERDEGDTDMGARAINIADYENVLNKLYEVLKMSVDEADPKKDFTDFLETEQTVLATINTLNLKEERRWRGRFVRLLNRLYTKEMLKELPTEELPEIEAISLSEELFQGLVDDYPESDRQDEAEVEKLADIILQKIRDVWAKRRG